MGVVKSMRDLQKVNKQMDRTSDSAPSAGQAWHEWRGSRT
jgi:hypothetical protein